MARAENEAKRLGQTQRLVLRLLASSGACSARTLAYHWPNLSEGAAYSAIVRLADRGLVDVAGFEGFPQARTYKLTEIGSEVEALLSDGDDD